MKKVKVIAISAFIILVTVFLFLTGNRDEKIISKSLRILAQTISKSKDDNNLILITKTQKIQSLFANDCRLTIEYDLAPEIEGLDELTAAFHQFYKLTDKIKVDFYDISITIAESRLAAKINMTVKATGHDPQESKRVTAAQEVNMLWRKIDKKWKIVEVKAIKTLY